MENNKPIIFLDFDGTTIPLFFEKTMVQLQKLSQDQLKSSDRYGLYFHSGCMENITKIVEKYNVDIVVTSTWKNHLGLLKLQEMWKYRGYHGNIIGITPENNDLNKRGLEIRAFLTQNPNKTGYVIIDDMGESFFEKEQVKQMVLCNPDFGFTDDKFMECCKILDRLAIKQQLPGSI